MKDADAADSLFVFFRASFIATDQSITCKEKTECIFGNPGNLPCASRKIYSLREVTVFQSKLSSSSGAGCASERRQCRFTSTSADRERDAVAGGSAGVGAVSVEKHSEDSELIGSSQSRQISLSCRCEDTQRKAASSLLVLQICDNWKTSHEFRNVFPISADTSWG